MTYEISEPRLIDWIVAIAIIFVIIWSAVMLFDMAIEPAADVIVKQITSPGKYSFVAEPPAPPKPGVFDTQLVIELDDIGRYSVYRFRDRSGEGFDCVPSGEDGFLCFWADTSSGSTEGKGSP